MCSRIAAAVSLLATLAPACDDTALVLELSSDLESPGELDGLCVSVAPPSGQDAAGTFAGSWRLDGELASWPQTLSLLPGDAGEVQVWARGFRDGVEVARDGARAAFEDRAVVSVPLDLSSCPASPGASSPRVAGMAGGTAYTHVVVPLGWRGPRVLAAGDGVADVYVAGGDLAVVEGGAPAPAGAVTALIAVDVDGDCDDDVIVASGGEARLWRQGPGGAFTDEGAVAGAAARAVAAADVDDDGDRDLVLGDGAALALARNDGTGRFQLDAAAIPGGAASDVTALAFGDLNGDGHADLLVGQGLAAPAVTRLFVNDAAGGGFFEPAAAALPATPLRARSLVARDLDGDGDVDAAVASQAAPVKLWVNRGDGRLEDRSFVRLPSTDVVDAVSVAAADFDGDCLIDLAVGLAGAAPLLLRGTDTGELEDASLPGGVGAGAAALADANGDGTPDLTVAGAEVTWVAPR